MELDLAELSAAMGREVADYTIEPIDPELRVHSVTGGVYRVRVDGDSLIIKVVVHGEDADPDGLWVAGSEPSHRNYWKREWEAYCSGLLDALPGELRAPRTMRCTELSEDECWIWMEDVVGLPGAQWQVEDYDSVAFDLATTQAAYASGRSILPSYPWLARGWLRSWVETLGRQLDALDDDALWATDEMSALNALRPRIRAIWNAREDLLGIVEAAPQTIVHCDFWPTNLIAADDGTTVALDWSQVGVGALAQDIDQLILDPIWMHVLPDGPLDALETGVVRGYASGLRTSGLDVGDVMVRHWYAAAASIHYAPMAGFFAVAAQDPASLEARFTRTFGEIARDRSRVIEHAVELGEAALADR
jgi:Phosphotransferase enzyme family